MVSCTLVHCDCQFVVNAVREGMEGVSRWDW
jgi:hypothetical protein